MLLFDEVDFTVIVDSPILFSDDEYEDEDVTDSVEKISLSRIYQELQITQEAIRDVRSESRDIHQELTKLTAKVNKFSYRMSSVIYFLLFQDNDHYYSFSYLL